MSLLASVSNNLKFWDFNNNNLLLNSTAEFGGSSDKAAAYSSHLLALAWNHNHKVIAVGGNSQQLHLVQANSGQILSSLPIDEKDSFVGDIRALSFSHNSRYLASAIEQDVAVWDLKTRNIRVRLRGHKTNLTSLQFTNEGAVVSGDTSGALVLWNIDQNTQSKQLLNPGYRSPLHCLKLSPGNNSHVCCGYGDGSVTVWDTQSLSPRYRCPSAHNTAVTALACSPKNDRLIATGSKDGSLQLVDLGSKHDQFSAVVGMQVGDEISSISFHESALYTAVGTETGYIYIYDWRNSQKPVIQVAGHNPMRVYDLAFQVCAC